MTNKDWPETESKYNCKLSYIEITIKEPFFKYIRQNQRQLLRFVNRHLNVQNLGKLSKDCILGDGY